MNQVIRVTGHMKAFGNRKYVNAVNIRPSEDPHEIYFHTMEALTVSLSLHNGMVRVIFPLPVHQSLNN